MLKVTSGAGADLTYEIRAKATSLQSFVAPVGNQIIMTN